MTYPPGTFKAPSFKRKGSVESDDGGVVVNGSVGVDLSFVSQMIAGAAGAGVMKVVTPSIPGEPGKPGLPGKDGRDGKDGRGMFNLDPSDVAVVSDPGIFEIPRDKHIVICRHADAKLVLPPILIPDLNNLVRLPPYHSVHIVFPLEQENAGGTGRRTAIITAADTGSGEFIEGDTNASRAFGTWYMPRPFAAATSSLGGVPVTQIHPHHSVTFVSFADGLKWLTFNRTCLFAVVNELGQAR